MSQPIYRKLAQKLDALPNGFPATESGIELRLLAKIFTPEEAALASSMRLSYESAAEIAARAGVDRKSASRRLKSMARKGQIQVRKGQGHLLFSLMPFVVGIYEAQLPRMDAELAALFERYLQESQGSSFVRQTPAVHRVIPVEEAISTAIDVFPYERAAELLSSAKAWGVRDCICRVQQRLIGQGCESPLEACLVFAPVEGAFKNSQVDRAITQDEALQILRQAEEAGLIHTSGNYRTGHTYICNCCTCCCGILRSVSEFGAPLTAVRSDFYAVVDGATCTGCGACVDQCRFGALTVAAQTCHVDRARCVGCGLCGSTCPNDALHLARRPEGEIPTPPADEADWMERRAQARGIPLEDAP